LKHLVLIFFLIVFSVTAFSQKELPQINGLAEKTAIRFYPNPAVDNITFEFNSTVERGYTLQIYSFLGRKVMTIPVSSSRVTLNISELFKGVYVFQLRDGNGRIVASNKFQVNK
jgi:hypothetical protein